MLFIVFYLVWFGGFYSSLWFCCFILFFLFFLTFCFSFVTCFTVVVQECIVTSKIYIYLFEG